MKIVDSYLADVFSVWKYYKSSEAPSECRKTILTDSLKCIVIGACFGMVLKFSAGKSHYTRMMKWAFYGGGFGLGYSFYFTNQKVETYLVRRKLGLN